MGAQQMLLMQQPDGIASMPSGGTMQAHASVTLSRGYLVIGSDGQITVDLQVGSDLSAGLPTKWWTNPVAGIGSGYKVRCTVNSGSLLLGDTTGVFLALSSSRSFGNQRNSPGTTTANVTIDIANLADTVLASFTCDIKADIT